MDRSVILNDVNSKLVTIIIMVDWFYKKID